MLASTPAQGFSADEILEVLQDPAVKFTTTPERVQKYADFMYRAGAIRTPAATWTDVFFPDVHHKPGS